MDDEKRAYDQAAEAFCDHVQDCAICTMTGPRCEAGNDLLHAENDAWHDYREHTRATYRVR